MSFQRRPPPPPPPVDGGPPPLPDRNIPTSLSSGDFRPALPARHPPVEEPQAPLRNPRQKNSRDIFEADYLDPKEKAGGPQATPRKCSHKEDEFEETYLLPKEEAETPQFPVAKPALPPSTRKTTPPSQSKVLKPWNSFREALSRPQVSSFAKEEGRRKISAPARPHFMEDETKVNDQSFEDGAENYEELPEIHPAPAAHLANHSSDEDSDEDWPSFTSEDLEGNVASAKASDLFPTTDGGANPCKETDDTYEAPVTTDNGLYLTPDGGNNVGQVQDDTYTAPDTGFDQSIQADVPKPSPPEPVIKPKSTIIKELSKKFNQSLNNINNNSSSSKPNKSPGPFAKAKATFTLPTPPKPTPVPRPTHEDSGRKGFEPRPALPSHPKPYNERPNKPLVPPNKPLTPPNKPSLGSMPSKTPVSAVNAPPPVPPNKPGANHSPALPPNHPTRDNRSEDGSAGSLSSGSGGQFPGGVLSELNQVIAPRRHAESAQSRPNLPNSSLPNANDTDGGGEIYCDGATEPEHLLAVHDWYHEDAIGKTAEERVKRVNQEGAFLVRPSSQNTSGLQKYTLVVFAGDKTCSLHINQRTDTRFAIGTVKPDETRFDTVPALIEHHLNFNISLSNGGFVKLSKPAKKPQRTAH